MTEISFSATGLARIRVASGPSAEVELLHSLYMLNERPIRCFAPWRQHLRKMLDRPVRTLVDVLAAHDRADATPSRAALGRERSRLLNAYEEVAIAPFWTRIRTLVDADRSRRARVLVDGGVEQLLATLHPAIRWRTPVLRVAQVDGRVATLSLDGDGLLLQPSVFVWRAPVLRRLGTGQPALLYPVSCEISGGGHQPSTGRPRRARGSHPRHHAVPALGQRCDDDRAGPADEPVPGRGQPACWGAQAGRPHHHAAGRSHPTPLAHPTWHDAAGSVDKC